MRSFFRRQTTRRWAFPALGNRVSPGTVGRGGSALVLLILLLLTGGLLISFVRMIWTEHLINQQSQRQAAINQTEREANLAKKGEAEFRDSDVYAEQAAREQLGMARDGETVLLPTVVAAPSPTATPLPLPSAAANAPPDEDVPNYQRWWQALFPAAPSQP